MSLLNDLLDGAIPIPYPTICPILDKESSIRQYVSYMLDRTNTMFEWENLPPTIPPYLLELYLQIFGYAAFLEVSSTTPIPYSTSTTPPPGLYIFSGGIGGERDIYYRPKLFTVANPRLKNSIQSTILYPSDSIPDSASTSSYTVLMPNDRNYMGLLPLYNRYAQQLAENDISIRSAQINGRAQIGISTSTDRDKETARKYLDSLEAGKLGIIGESAFLEGVQVSNISTQSANTIIQLIELQQYLKASWYNELGLNVNFNMKREYMSEEEIAVNTDILLPLVDDMYNCRVEYSSYINSIFGLSISVHKSSAWANKEQELLSSIAEATLTSGIPLSQEIQDKIEGDSTDSQIQTPVQSEVSDSLFPIQSTESRTITNSGNDTEVAPSGDSEQLLQSSPDTPPSQSISLNINISTEEGDNNIDISTPESETQEVSEEPDSESSVS